MCYSQPPRWIVQKPDQAAVNSIMQTAGLPLLSAIALANRGVHPLAASLFLDSPLSDLPDPFLMKDMAAAADRLAFAIMSRQKVTVWLDYDVDGVTSGALLVRFGRLVGADFGHYIPHRVGEGYGLNEDGIRQIAGAKQTDLLVTVDCGITAIDQAALCKELDLDVVITDHHTPGDRLPEACAVVNPHRQDCDYPFKALCGAGVAFNLAIATRKILRGRGWFSASRPEPNLCALLPLVALGTVADIVELQGVNRILVAKGIDKIRERRHSVVGLESLCNVAGSKPEEVSAGHIGFRLAPRLNASGRMGSAQMAFELLTTDSATTAHELAAELDRLNTERQIEEERVIREAVEMVETNKHALQRKTIVLGGNWHPGVIGIAASRLVERYHRPTILIAWDGERGKGSCRSIKPFHIYDGLCACADFLIGFGGHPMAAGLSVEAKDFDGFCTAFEESAAHLTEEDLQPVLVIDAEITAPDVSLSVCDTLDRLEPFGMGNSRPVFCLYGCEVRAVKILKEKHLKLELVNGGCRFSAIGFNMASMPLSNLVDVAFTAEKNEWNGNVSLQLGLKSIRLASATV